ncbi:ubiquitin-protein transferase [Aureococcus anophagefferens]|nr:ubiquitin-protein transferase [Aureococcus anophagefferens]
MGDARPSAAPSTSGTFAGDLGVPYDAADRVVRAAASTPSLEPQTARGIHPATCCPLTGRVMRDPVVAACGNSFELEAIAHWLARNETSPVTQEKLASKLLFPNAALRSIIRAGHRP